MVKSIKKPTISVIMSVYNDAKYVGQAIDSVLNQSFTDFEFIIINDGSTDDTKKIIDTFKDPRISLINQKNHGLVYSLNKGIAMSKGTYITRQDSDDISEPTRFHKQIEAYENNSRLVLLGSSMRTMDENNKILNTHHVLLGNGELKQELLVRSPFAHGSVMFKKQAVIEVGLYNPSAWPAEDYDLWLRLSEKGDFANIDEPLYIYRENSAGISAHNKLMQSKRTALIRKLAWQKYKASLVTNDSRVDIARYFELEDGDQRVRRIKDNILVSIRNSVSHGSFIILKRLLVLLITVTLERRKLNQKSL